MTGVVLSREPCSHSVPPTLLPAQITAYLHPTFHTRPTHTVVPHSPQVHPGDANLMLGVARVYDALNDSEKALQFYKNVGGV